MSGRFRADPFESYVAVSISCVVIVVGVLVIRALSFGSLC